MKFDVVIPAFNSAAILPRTLAALFAQDVPAGWAGHVIISDDGSRDTTREAAENIPLPPRWQRSLVSGPHAGPGEARNRALTQAKGDVVVFLGADILLRPGALATHLVFHELRGNITDAALGMVRFDPRLPPTPFLEWMVHDGQQNDFDSLLGETTASPAHFFYCSHLSLKRSLLPTPAFSRALRAYGWEDLHLGRELEARGVVLHILHGAIGLHHHRYSITAIAARQSAAGESLPLYQKLHPDVVLIPSRSFWNHLRRALFIAAGGHLVLRAFLALTAAQYAFPRLFLLFTSIEFWRGVWRRQGEFLALLREKGIFSTKIR